MHHRLARLDDAVEFSGGDQAVFRVGLTIICCLRVASVEERSSLVSDDVV